jgi:putative transposase
MGRPAGLHYKGALFHVMSRGNGKQDIFLDSHDKISFLNRLLRIKLETKFSLYAYCLMTNHFHFLIRVHDVSISQIMQRLLSGYSREFNRKWDRRGHAFEDRYKWIHCSRDVYFRELVRYIHMNPVKAGIVASPEHWLWSGYKELVDSAPPKILDKDFVLSMFGGGPSAAEQVKDFTLKNGDIDLNWMEHTQESDLLEPEVTATNPEFDRPPLASIEDAIVKKHELPDHSLPARSRTTILLRARTDFILTAIKHGHKLSEIARYLKRDISVVCRIVNPRSQLRGVSQT